MAPTPGTRFGPYEVGESIGSGGMGEVYRARDTTLERAVAIKVLPASFAAAPDRTARFEQEAKLLATLNHTNIAQIYGLEKSGASHALVMELVEGPTLAERIEQGPLPADEALGAAMQIAAALEAAHAVGIVHRDLKPANIKLRPDGAVKVLDFGIAKALESPGASSGPRSPALTTPAMTEAGMILGTAAYMAPEQARGRPVDQRADIWAFGCVLYEMLTGQQAFGGDDVTTTLARVLERDVDIEALPDAASAAVRQTIDICLRKDPAKRWHAIGDVRLALEGELALAPAPAAGLETPSTRPTLKRMLVPAAALVAGAAIAAFAAVNLRPPLPSPALQHLSIVLPESLPLLVANNGPAIAVSHDGTKVAYRAVTGAPSGLAVRRLDNSEPVVVYDSVAAEPFFSPDDDWVAFWDPSSGSMRRVAVTGGPALTIRTGGLESGAGVAWSRDNTMILAGESFDGLWELSPGADRPEPLTRLDTSRGEFWHASPSILPGDEVVLFGAAYSTGAGFAWELSAVNRSTGERRSLGLPVRHGKYLPTGHLVYGDRGSLWAVPFDPESLELGGSPVAVLSGVAANAGGYTQFDVDAEGSLVYIAASSDASPDRPMLIISRAGGEAARLPLPAGDYVQPRASPRGDRIAIGRDDGQGPQVWIYDVTGDTAPRRLTFDGENSLPVWSGDGARVAFQSERQDGSGIYWRRADGSGSAVPLTAAEAGTTHIPNSWSPDGRYLLFDVYDGSAYTLWTVSLEDGQMEPYGNVQSVQRTDAAFSPDGRWVAYTYSDIGGGGRSANRGIFVQPFPADGSRYPVPKTGLDFHPAWAPDGKQLFYIPGSAIALVSVSVDTSGAATFGEPLSVQGAPTPGVVSTQPKGYDVLPDGRFVAINTGAMSAAEQPRIDIVLNWAAEVERLVPTD